MSPQAVLVSVIPPHSPLKRGSLSLQDPTKPKFNCTNPCPEPAGYGVSPGCQTWLGVRTKKGRGTGTSPELGHSSSEMSDRLSRKPPPACKGGRGCLLWDNGAAGSPHPTSGGCRDPQAALERAGRALTVVDDALHGEVALPPLDVVSGPSVGTRQPRGKAPLAALALPFGEVMPQKAKLKTHL